ncbi:MAG: exopolyphosphatase [Bacteroidetes bacterium]|nr:exopolyphosphatase [Bacteroidota bacterium]
MTNTTSPLSGGTADFGVFAVMDLGTNTFHLLIAEGTMNDLHEIVREQVAVKLGEGGISKGVILPEAFERGLNAMKEFKSKIDHHRAQKIRAIATSAVRNASNGQDFIQQVKAGTGIEIEIISGDKEAELIYQGIKATGLLTDENALVIDIGGGSIEFIICNKDHLFWKQSFEIGAARLMERFHRTDPIPPDAVEAINVYLENTLTSLFDAIKKMPVQQLIGSSGSFETFAELIESERSDNFDLTKIKHYPFHLDELLQVTGKLIASSHSEREANKLIIPVRVDMIVVSSVVTRYIIHRLGIRNVALSIYSLKEGVLAEMME